MYLVRVFLLLEIHETGFTVCDDQKKYS